MFQGRTQQNVRIGDLDRGKENSRMKAKFEIQVTTGSLYRFLMYHTYHELSGIFSIIAGFVILALYVWSLSSKSVNSWIYLAFSLLFFLYLPWTLYTRAARQAKLNPVFKKPLAYVVSDDGILVMQEKDSNEVKWESVLKVRETGKSILVYTSARSAFLWVKSQMGAQEETARKLLLAHVDARKVKLKSRQR